MGHNQEYFRAYYRKNRDRILAQNKKWKLENRDSIRETRRRWRANNRDKLKSQWTRDNEKKRMSGAARQYAVNRYSKHAESIRARRRNYYYANREKERAYNVKYCSENRARISAQRKLRRHTDIEHSIAEKLRRTLVKVMNRFRTYKAASAFALLGCEVSFFVAHIESLFQPGMAWENYGRHWHIDHHVPIKAFDMNNPEHQKWCFFWKNLQPMTKSDNFKKRDKVPNPLPDWLPAHIAERIIARSVRPKHPRS